MCGWCDVKKQNGRSWTAGRDETRSEANVFRRSWIPRCPDVRLATGHDRWSTRSSWAVGEVGNEGSLLPTAGWLVDVLPSSTLRPADGSVTPPDAGVAAT